MKISTKAFLLAFLASRPLNIDACPFSKTTDEMPSDSTHNRLRGRRLASLSQDDTTREKLAAIISKQKRSLQIDECVTNQIYENIRVALEGMTNVISDLGDRGHFIGGIVRLAAHDFMDFDINASDQLGSDGCLEFSHPANAGLPDLWCDNPTDCPFKALYDDVYSAAMSRADFWVAAANAVIKITSPNQSLDLTFRSGRIDSDNCPNSSGRLPEPAACDDVEGAFITRMGLTWTDAVALLGAHTLGRGDQNFSGHPGTWVQSDEESTIFDKQFYEEVLNRGWRPRQTDTDVADNDWTWGGRNRGVMMLNTDICLRYDIDDGSPCCTNTNQDCRDNSVQNIQCDDSSDVRPEAFAAFNEFVAGNRGDNDAFFSAFSSAWVKATENGYDSLLDLVNICEETLEPTLNPTGVIVEPTLNPTGICSDVDSFIDMKGRTRDCAWVEDKDKCRKFSDECPVTCNAC